MFKLEFTLKQHTPLIHFQGNQEGATLRATEVKPKLDKFITQFIDINSNSDYLRWYQKTHDRISFNYKITIKPEGPITNKPINPNDNVPFFFGHMGEEYLNNKKYLSFTNHKVFITITSLCSQKVNNENLLELISSIIPQFFLLNNFGTRQSKAYGSFYLHLDDPLYVDPIQLNYELSEEMQGYYCPISSNKNNHEERVKEIYEKLDLFYKALRSGINNCFQNPNYYIKSLLWLYYKSIEPNLKWEKRKIKEEFFKSHLAKQLIDHEPVDLNTPLFANGPNEFAIKDLLGLSSSEAWKIPYYSTITKLIQNVERFSSPLQFKILNIEHQNFIVFIFINEPESENSLLSRQLTINDLLTMNYPNNFSYNGFLNYIFRLNLEDIFMVVKDDEKIPVSQLEDREIPPHFKSINYFLENFQK